MKIECISPKSYKITKGKLYSIIFENKQLYTIVNDIGNTVSYTKSLFKKEEIIEIVKTDEEIVKNIMDSLHIEDFYCNFYYKGKEIILLCDNTYISRSEISCGIGEISGLNDLVDIIKVNVPNILDLQSQLFNKFIEYLISTDNFTFILISTNITDCHNHYNNENKNESFDLISKYMDKKAIYYKEGFNEKSGNNIKLWIL